MLARCVIGMQWIPENILRVIGTRAASSSFVTRCYAVSTRGGIAG